jgi:lipid II:glycine glycyltransferase (peptidoglycan interpeptide bridge formation enzyme)
MRRLDGDQLNGWDARVLANPDGGNVLQLRAFGEFKRARGWRPEYVLHEVVDAAAPGGRRELAVLYLVRRAPVFGELWYAPKGPGAASVAQVGAVLADFAAPHAFLLKVEPELTAADDARNPAEVAAPGADGLAGLGLRKAKFDLQMNRSTVVVDLKPSEDDIINSFKQKTRYNIRLAERKGVTVEAVELTAANEAKMLELMRATQARGGFFMRDDAYVTGLWREYAAAGQGQLFFASFEGRVLAGAFVLHAGVKGLYKDGGSVREHTDLQPPYALHWFIMRWLKQRGVAEYDLHGTPPAASAADPNHPLAGLAKFKTGFNPDHVIDYVGVYDLPLKPLRYRLWQSFGERLVTKYFVKVRRQLFY